MTWGSRKFLLFSCPFLGATSEGTDGLQRFPVPCFDFCLVFDCTKLQGSGACSTDREEITVSSSLALLLVPL